MMGGGGMPGMGGMPNMPQAQVPPVAASSVLPAAQKADLEKAESLKLEANALFKNSQFQEASTKYLAAINSIRLNDDLAKSKAGKEAEMACRSNLSMCKLNLKEFDLVVEQCERILDYDPANIKASFRMSKAVFALSEGKSSSQLKVALKYAIVAKDGSPTDKQVKSHYDEVKAKHDEVLAAAEETKSVPEERKGSNMEKQMRSRVKIPIDGEDEEETKAP